MRVTDDEPGFKPGELHDMLAAADAESATVREARGPIPPDVWWDIEKQDFVNELHQDMGLEFLERWEAYSSDFPVWREPQRPALFKGPIEEIGAAENSRVTETITSDEQRQRLLLADIGRQIEETDRELGQLGLQQSEIEQSIRDRNHHRAELLMQRRDCLARIDLYGRMLHEASMAALRQSHA